MQTITIQIESEELGTTDLELNQGEVKAMYLRQRDLIKQVAELQKKVVDKEQHQKYLEQRIKTAEDELQQADVLLTAMGVAEKSNEEDAYRRVDLPVATRIALYLAKR